MKEYKNLSDVLHIILEEYCDDEFMTVTTFYRNIVIYLQDHNVEQTGLKFDLPFQVVRMICEQNQIDY